jgi:hypothetical protein
VTDSPIKSETTAPMAARVALAACAVGGWIARAIWVVGALALLRAPRPDFKVVCRYEIKERTSAK